MDAGQDSEPATRQQRFERLLHEHRRIVFKIAGVYARSLDDRHDLAQEITAQLWRAFPAYDEARRFSTWMYRIALNVGISFSRTEQNRAGRFESLDEDTAVASFDISDATNFAADEPDERLIELRKLIAALDALNRAVLVLYLEERSYAEIAEILGITETNVATKIGRIKQRLRVQMLGSQLPNLGQGG